MAARGLFEEAELYGRRALELRRAASTGQNLDVAQAELDIGLLLLLVGRGSEAERHLQKALDSREDTLGPEDPATDLVKNCLAYLSESETL